jgi:hypothetical protein
MVAGGYFTTPAIAIRSWVFGNKDFLLTMAAWLCHNWTGATLSELGPYIGLGAVDSVSNLVRHGREQAQQVTKMAANRKADRMRAEPEHRIQGLDEVRVGHVFPSIPVS